MHGIIGQKLDWILEYLYPYLFYLMNIDMDTGISWIQKFIFIFVLNGNRYKLNTESLEINMDISWIIIYDYIIKYIIKSMKNQFNSMLIPSFISFK